MDGYQPYHFGRGDPPPQPPLPPQQQQPPQSSSWYPPPYPPRHPWPAPPSHQWAPQPNVYPNQQWPPYHPPPPPHHAAPYPPAPQPSGGPWALHHMPQPSNYPPPQHSDQAWARTSWSNSQAMEHQDRANVYNSEEDWATKAKAWVAANSVTESHQQQPYAMTTGMPEGHNYAYNEQYRQPAGVPTETVRPSPPQSSFQQMLGEPSDQQNETKYVHSTSFYSDATTSMRDGTKASSGGSQVVIGENRQTTPSSLNSVRHTYEQEVPYNYSSTSATEDASSHGSTFLVRPPTASSIQDSFHHQPSGVPLLSVSPERPLFQHEGILPLLSSDMSDQPLEFSNRSDPATGVHQTTIHQVAGPGPGVFGGPSRLVDRELMAVTSHSWTPGSSTGLYQQTSLPLPPVVRQSEPPVASQPSLPVNPPPLFGVISGPTYRPPIPHLPVGGSSLAPPSTENFPSDPNSLMLERPKKVLPKWFQEELLKNKPMSGSGRGLQQSRALHSMESDDVETSLEKSHQSDSKSIDSAKSAEDEDGDEDEVQAARSAAVNQEIKRVLTEVLLKVTDDLFAEIATKVLSEDDSPHGANESTGSALLDLKKTSSPVLKEPAKILIAENIEKNNSHSGSNGHQPNNIKGNILGLANYASDDDDDEDDTKPTPPVHVAETPHHETVSQHDHNSVSNIEDFHKEENKVDNIEQSNETHQIEYSSIHTTSDIDNGMLNYKSPPKRKRSMDGDQQLSDVQVDANKNLGPASQQESNTAMIVNRPVECSDGDAERSNPAQKSTLGNRVPSDEAGKKEESSLKVSEDVRIRHESGISVELNCGSDRERKSLKERVDTKHYIKDKDDKASAMQVVSHARGTYKHRDAKDNVKDSRMDLARDAQDSYKDDVETRDRRHDRLERSRQVSKNATSRGNRRSPSPGGRHRSRRSPSPRGRSHAWKENSSNENSDKSKRRQVSRSPHSKHSHSRQSPYPSERRSRSRTPVKRRR